MSSYLTGVLAHPFLFYCHLSCSLRTGSQKPVDTKTKNKRRIYSAERHATKIYAHGERPVSESASLWLGWPCWVTKDDFDIWTQISVQSICGWNHITMTFNSPSRKLFDTMNDHSITGQTDFQGERCDGRTAALNGPISKKDWQTDWHTDCLSDWQADLTEWLTDCLPTRVSHPSIYPSTHHSTLRSSINRCSYIQNIVSHTIMTDVRQNHELINKDVKSICSRMDQPVLSGTFCGTRLQFWYTGREPRRLENSKPPLLFWLLIVCNWGLTISLLIPAAACFDIDWHPS